MKIAERIQIISEFLSPDFEFQCFNGVSLSTNRHIMVATETPNFPDTEFGERWMSLIPDVGGTEIGISCPTLFYSADSSFNPFIKAVLSVGIFEDGSMTIWNSMTEEQKKACLIRLNLGLFSGFWSHFEQPYIRLWIRGPNEAVRFEFEDFFGAVMPMRKDRD